MFHTVFNVFLVCCCLLSVIACNKEESTEPSDVCIEYNIRYSSSNAIYKRASCIENKVIADKQIASEDIFYHVFGELPEGLSFNVLNGTISGKLQNSSFLSHFEAVAVIGKTVCNFSLDITVLKDWMPPIDLSDYISGESTASSPVIATDAKSNAVIVWAEPAINGYRKVFVKEYKDTNDDGVKEWGTPFIISDSSIESHVDSPQVAMNSNGEAIVVWSQSDKIYKNEYLNDLWGTASILSSGAPAYATFQKVAMDKDGNIIVVWRQEDSDSIYKIYVSEYKDSDSDGVKEWDSTPGRLSLAVNGDVNNSNNLQLAMGNNGHAIALWIQNNQIYKSEYLDTNDDGVKEWPGSSLVSLTGTNPIIYKAAVDAEGNIIFVWKQAEGGSDTSMQIFSKEYKDTNDDSIKEWTTSQSVSGLITLYDMTSPISCDLTMNANGNAIIVWSQEIETGKFQIFKKEYKDVDNDGAKEWSSSSVLSENILKSDNTFEQYSPKISMNNNNDVSVVWQQYDASNCQIFITEYKDTNNDGVKEWDNPSLLDSISPDGSDASSASVSINDNDYGIIAWLQSNKVFVSDFK